MAGSAEDIGKKKQLANFTLTDTKFEELKKLLQNYLKITALAAIRDTNESNLERNARILDAAGYAQNEIGEILHVSQSTISRILAGTWKEGKKNGGGEK